ncbi:BON domain-containing protein [Streptomyces sp. NPDC101237]|uniref:BON domain-containing protein n=1 Tax=Streptomyces sp. NPDC101237 TaxID=3366139 RepID=UPI003814FB2D
MPRTAVPRLLVPRSRQSRRIAPDGARRAVHGSCGPCEHRRTFAGTARHTSGLGRTAGGNGLPAGRGDLLRIFLRSDDAIRQEITRDLLRATLRLEPAGVDVRVRSGHVGLTGTVEYRSLGPVVEQVCRGVDGAVPVAGNLTWRKDDARPSPSGS